MEAMMAKKINEAVSDFLKDMFMYVKQVLFIMSAHSIWLTFRVFRGKTIRNPLNPVWVDPAEIQCVITTSTLPSRSFLKFNRRLGGLWDRNIIETEKCVGDLSDFPPGIIPIEHTDIHKAFVHHFQNGGDWKETEWYTRVSSQILSGIRKWRCSDLQSFDARLGRIEDLYQRIQQNGYRTQRELRTPRYWDEIRIGVGRDGELFLFDGRHRLSMAKLLGLKKIPVFIALYHDYWEGDLSTMQNLFGVSEDSQSVAHSKSQLDIV